MLDTHVNVPPWDVRSGWNSMTSVLFTPLTLCGWITTPSLSTLFPTHFSVGILSLITVHVRVKLSPAVGWSSEASISTSFVKDAVGKEV